MHVLSKLRGKQGILFSSRYFFLVFLLDDWLFDPPLNDDASKIGKTANIKGLEIDAKMHYNETFAKPAPKIDSVWGCVGRTFNFNAVLSKSVWYGFFFPKRG